MEEVRLSVERFCLPAGIEGFHHAASPRRRSAVPLPTSVAMEVTLMAPSVSERLSY